MPQSPISKSLLELSDAIEQLAMIISQQKKADNDSQIKQFSLIVKKFSKSTQLLQQDTKKSSIKYIRKWCNLLHKNKIIDSFIFLDNNQIDVDIAEIHKATSFINGYWLEILLRKEIALIMRKYFNKIKNYDILVQVELVKPNRRNSEIDLLLMLNQKVYWFECKSGSIGNYYKRFNAHRKLLTLDANHSFLVVPTMQMHQAKVAMKRCGMTMLYGTSLEIQLPKILFNN